MIPESSVQPERRSHSFKSYRLWTLVVVVAVLASILADVTFAANSGKTITLGESLDQVQKQELLDYFGQKKGDKVITVTAADTRKAMEGIISLDFVGAYSSTALTCRDLGDGLDVTTRNITVVTPSMFAMALVTAGIGDAKLVVAAPDSAQAQGMTALTGVFKTWDIAPCASGETTRDRQRLATEELALTVDIGNALFNFYGLPNGVQLASNLVLESQKTIVIEKLKKPEEIDRAIADQELAAGISIPADLRVRLIDLMVRLQKEKIDWSTFSAGWTIEYNENNTQIKMRGEGIAIRHARQTATAEAANQMTATAQAAVQLTAEAGAALTATAQARRPEATATPGPATVSGSISNIGDGEITINGSRGEVTYKLDADAPIVQGDAKIAVSDLTVGDHVTATIEGGSTVASMSVSVPTPGLMSKLAKFVLIIPILALAPVVVILIKKRPAREPFIVRRVAA